MGRQGKYPVIFISLKDVTRGDYQAALRSVCDKISDLYEVDSEEGFYANAEGYLEQLEEDLEEVGA